MQRELRRGRLDGADPYAAWVAERDAMEARVLKAEADRAIELKARQEAQAERAQADRERAAALKERDAAQLEARQAVTEAGSVLALLGQADALIAAARVAKAGNLPELRKLAETFDREVRKVRSGYGLIDSLVRVARAAVLWNRAAGTSAIAAMKEAVAGLPREFVDSVVGAQPAQAPARNVDLKQTIEGAMAGSTLTISTTDGTISTTDGTISATGDWMPAALYVGLLGVNGDKLRMPGYSPLPLERDSVVFGDVPSDWGVVVGCYLTDAPNFGAPILESVRFPSRIAIRKGDTVKVDARPLVDMLLAKVSK